MPYLGECKGIVCKNLFLKGKKKGDLWLVTVGHNKEVNLSQLAKKLTVSKGLRFADEAILEKTLGVKQGCVTPLSLFKDTEKLVQVVLDQDIKTLPSEQMVYSHPMQNSATTGMSSSDFIKFVEYTKHTPIFIEL